jgi:hypothetical protein
MRFFVLGLLLPAAAITSGCPQGSGELISVSPTTLDFGASATSLTFEVTNTGSFFTTAQFQATPQFLPWVLSIEPATGQSFALFGAGTRVVVTVTINRAQLSPGVNTGIILVGPTVPESTAEAQVLTVRALGEGVVEGEGEGVFEGEGEGGTEGEGEGGLEEGEGEEVIVCPEPCAVANCGSQGVNAGVETALTNLLLLPIINQDPLSADLDQNGIADTAHGKLLDTILFNNSFPVHCCVLSAWNTNLALVELALDEFEQTPESEDILEIISRADLERVFAGLATIGERRSQNVLAAILDQLGITLDASAFDLSARMYVASDGDTDLDGVCNLAEYRGALLDPFGFIINATDPEAITDGGGCGAPCYEDGGTEAEDGEVEAEDGEVEAEEDGEIDTDVLCQVVLNSANVVPSSGSAATGIAVFKTFNDQVLLQIDHSVSNPVSIAIFPGAPGENTGNAFFTMPSPTSPSFALLAPQFYEFVNDDHYILITSSARPSGDIRGNIACGGGSEEGEGEGEGVVEGEGEGTDEGEGEGVVEGEGEGSEEGEQFVRHSADYLVPFGRITLSELIRGIQFFNNKTEVKGAEIILGAYGCAPNPESTDDTYLPGSALQTCAPHNLDYLPQDWRISLTELLRLIQIYNGPNGGAYNYCPNEDPERDDFCLGS